VALNQHFVKREFRKNLMSIVLAFPILVRRGIRVVLSASSAVLLAMYGSKRPVACKPAETCPSLPNQRRPEAVRLRPLS
jgi:hypothetical protein